MEILSIEIWEKFDDLSLPSFSTDLGFGETFFEDLFENDQYGNSFTDCGNSLVHLHEAIADLQCKFENEESLYSESNSFNPKDLEVLLQPIRDAAVNPVLLDHSYSQDKNILDDG